MTELRTAGEAKAVGSVKYFTGKPCARGHISERLASNNCCVLCQRENVSAWAAKNAERTKASCRKASKKWDYTNPEKKRKAFRAWRDRNIEEERARVRKYLSDHPARRKEYAARRRAAEKRHQPIWADVNA